MEYLFFSSAELIAAMACTFRSDLLPISLCCQPSDHSNEGIGGKLLNLETVHGEHFYLFISCFSLTEFGGSSQSDHLIKLII